jgi:hypothetical protein
MSNAGLSLSFGVAAFDVPATGVSGVMGEVTGGVEGV